jgi:hypothetical protein
MVVRVRVPFEAATVADDDDLGSWVGVFDLAIIELVTMNCSTSFDKVFGGHMSPFLVVIFHTLHISSAPTCFPAITL